MKRCIIIHGWAGKPEEGWMPWLRTELENRGWQVESPKMPNAKLPQLDEWLAELREVVGTPDAATYFVGHSLGCFTFLKYIEQLPPETKIGGGVMVAGFAGNLKHQIPVIVKYYEGGLDYEKIKVHGGKYVAIASERDDYVHIQSLQEFREHLGAQTITNNEWEHFSGQEGITELRDALNALLTISS